MVDDAVDRKCTLKYGWATGLWVSAVMDGDAGPSSLTGGAQAIRPPDSSGVIFEKGGLGVVVMDDFSTKDEDTLSVYRFYPIQNSAAAIGSCLEVLNVGAGVEKVVVGSEMEVECIFECADGDTDRVGVFQVGVGVD